MLALALSAVVLITALMDVWGCCPMLCRLLVRACVLGVGIGLGSLAGAVPGDSQAPAAETSLALAAQQFPQCVTRLQAQARSEGLAETLVTGPLAQVQFVPRVIELDRRQPEFTETFTNYFNRRVSAQRIERGRQLLREQAPLLQKLVRQYGVPPQYLVAFWGLETNFGSYLGKMPTLDSLATLACDQRRSRFFTTELFEALRLLQTPGVTPPLRGSWAGAVGHTQFMPSAYRRYAVDGDGDGRIDLWGSVADALTSAANFLQALGWQRELRWGREVLLPPNFDYGQMGLKHRRPLAEWAQQGLRTAFDGRLPGADVKAALLLPTGAQGPAFLVYDNFDVIMGWNRSEFYALAVGHLADRINGAGRLKRTPPPLPRLSLDKVRALQSQLNAEGFDAGDADGILGPATRYAIRAFQRAQGLVADGYPSEAVFGALGIDD